MSTPLRVSVTPVDNRVPVGGMAIFNCHTNPLFAERVQTFSWEAAVQIANETRYSFRNNSRTVLIKDVQENDHNTDVTCRVLTSRGRRGKASAKLLVSDAVGGEHHWGTTTVRPQLPEPSQPESVASPVIGIKDAFLLGTVLGVAGFFAIVVIGLKLYGYSVAKRVASGVIGESILLRRNVRVKHYEWSGKTTSNAGPEPRSTTQTYAELGETNCTNIYEDLKLPGLGLRPGCTNSLPPCVEFHIPTYNGTSDLRTYENFPWDLGSSDRPDVDQRTARWDRPGCSFSLPARCAPPPCGLATSSWHTHTDSTTDVTDDSRLTPVGNSYENILDVVSQPEYENQRTESFSSDVTYADLDFGSGFECSPSPSSSSPSPSSSSTVEQTGIGPTEYSKVQKVLSVYRSRSGSTRVTVEVINK